MSQIVFKGHFVHLCRETFFTHQIINCFLQLPQWWNEKQTRRKKASHLVPSQRNCFRFGTAGCFHTVSLLWIVDFLRAQLCTRIRYQVSSRRLQLSCNIGGKGQFSNASMTKTTPQNSSDPILSAGHLRFPKLAQKRTRDWQRTMLTRNPESINHYFLYNWSIQMDKKSVNRRHTRSLECIRWGKKEPASWTEENFSRGESSTSACFINSADALIAAESKKRPVRSTALRMKRTAIK